MSKSSSESDDPDSRSLSRQRRWQVHVERGIPRVRIPLRAIARAITRVGTGERVSGELNIVVTNDAEMLRLNRRYRGRRRPTDVLAFSLSDHDANGDLWGEIYCNYDDAKRWRDEFGGTITAELARLAVHGCLHLLGYDHHTEDERAVMAEAEDRYLCESGLIAKRNLEGTRRVR